MSSNVPLSSRGEDDYLAIEAAVMETARGRWFLSEYASRNRAADTASILEALTELEQIVEPIRPPSVDRRLQDIVNMLAEARSASWQCASDGQGRPAHVRPLLAAENAVSAIRSTAAKIREVASQLRETGNQETSASVLDLYCSDLAGACDLEETALRRLTELAGLLSTIEEKLAAPPSDDASVPAAGDASTLNSGAVTSPTPSAPPMQPETREEPVASAPPRPDKAETRTPAALMFVNPS